MKILLVSGSFPDMQCGVGDYCAHLAVGLASTGAIVSVLTSRHPRIAERRKDYFTDGVKVFDAVHRWDLSGLARIGEIIDEIEPDIVHIEYQTGSFGRKAAVNFLPVVVKRSHNWRRIVTTFHDCATPYLFPRAPRRLRRRTLLPLLCLSDGVIVSNHRDRVELSALHSGVLNRIAEIPVGSNIVFDPGMTSDAARLRRDIGIGPDEHLISCFGFVRDDRDNTLLLNAVNRLTANGLRVKLAFVGGFQKSPNTHRSVVNTVLKMGMSGNVFFTGYLAPTLVSQFLKASEVHVSCPRDGVATARCSLITALSHGIPTVATSLGDEPDCFKNRENIILVPPGDVEALALSIRDLLLSSSLRETLSKNAALLANAFSWETIVRQHLNVYREVLSSKTSGGRRPDSDCGQSCEPLRQLAPSEAGGYGEDWKL